MPAVVRMTNQSWKHGSPLKPEYGLNGPPKALVAGVTPPPNSRLEPDFLPRCAREVRVCAFHQGKAHGVYQRHKPPQEIGANRGNPKLFVARVIAPLTCHRRVEVRAVQMSATTAFWTAQLAECVGENAGKQNRVGCCMAALSIRLTRAKVSHGPSNLSSRAKRSAAEGSAVCVDGKRNPEAFTYAHSLVPEGDCSSAALRCAWSG